MRQIIIELVIALGLVWAISLTSPAWTISQATAYNAITGR